MISVFLGSLFMHHEGNIVIFFCFGVILMLHMLTGSQRFQKCEYAKTKLFKTEGRGWGLLADENIKVLLTKLALFLLSSIKFSLGFFFFKLLFSSVEKFT